MSIEAPSLIHEGTDPAQVSVPGQLTLEAAGVPHD